MTAAAAKKKPADLGRLKELDAEIEDLRAAGKWNLDEYKRVMTEASEAVGDQRWMLESIMLFRPAS